MRARAVLLAFTVVLGGLTLLPPRHRPQEPTDPLVRLLLHERVRGVRAWESPFFRALETLWGRGGARPADRFWSEYAFADEGYATPLGGYVLVVVRADSCFIPGTDTQHLLLLDRAGRVLDTLSCSVSNRITYPRYDDIVSGKVHLPTEAAANGLVTWQEGPRPGTDFHVDVLHGPEPDGAQVAIRLDPRMGGRLERWEHTVTHRGSTARYPWVGGFVSFPKGMVGVLNIPVQTVPGITADELEAKGLCRVAVRRGQFHVVFPAPGRALRVYEP